MAAEKRPKSPTSTEPKRRRLTLMESYDPDNSTFSDANLSEIASMIGAISAPSTEAITETTSPLGDSLSETLSEIPDEPRGVPRGHIVGAPFASPSQSPSDTPSQTSSGTLSQSPRDEPLLLTPNQALLYECAKLLDGRFTTLAHIARAVGISVDTLRSCQRKLRSNGLVSWTSENISGQNGMRLSAQTMPYTVRGNRQFLYEKLGGIDSSKLALNSAPAAEFHQVSHQVSHQIDSPSCSSSKEILLQGLILEGVFEQLNPSSLLPHLVSFETAEELQNFLDIANACITASHAGTSKPIQNPLGFLIAQLKAGYINPPEGYKSRRVRAQESRNEQLQAELADLQRLKAEEEQLRFEIFKTRLTAADQERLEQEAKTRIDRRSPASIELQIEMAQAEILSGWFAAENRPAAD